MSAEPTDLAAEFHVALDSQQMARLIASCDIFLGPSRHQEGFGLPAAEALASGLTCVLSEIPSFLSWGREYALFTPENDAVAMGDSLISAIKNRITGREVVEQFRAAKTGERLERYFMERRRAKGRTYSGGR